MTFQPLRARGLDVGTLLVNDTGDFFLASDELLDRLATDQLKEEDQLALRSDGHRIDEDDPFDYHIYAHGVAARLDHAGQLDYLILVPTLRCNLNCSYCQVSRAGLQQKGFDWDDATLTSVLALIDNLPTESIKIEFQGGEPSLRADLIMTVIDRCARFSHRQFVICTNLQTLDDAFISILDREDVYISTSLDGDALTHGQNRTGAATSQFLDNLAWVIQRYGEGKVSALPTINPRALPDIDGLIESYTAFGLTSIFLRPINFQGFARKRHKESREQSDQWRSFYERFIHRIIARNWDKQDEIVEETYLSICLRRIFQPGLDRHVDLRNPNPVGIDYVVIDYDGTVYPTDEARMLARSGVIDLSIGTVFSGWETEQRDLLNSHSTNQFDPSCQRCAYQPFCGRDLVDDLARYGRIDIERTETEFCKRHLHIYDFLFDLIYSDDPAVKFSLAAWLRLPSVSAAFGRMLS